MVTCKKVFREVVIMGNEPSEEGILHDNAGIWNHNLAKITITFEKVEI